MARLQEDQYLNASLSAYRASFPLVGTGSGAYSGMARRPWVQSCLYHAENWPGLPDITVHREHAKGSHSSLSWAAASEVAKELEQVLAGRMLMTRITLSQ